MEDLKKHQFYPQCVSNINKGGDIKEGVSLCEGLYETKKHDDSSDMASFFNDDLVVRSSVRIKNVGKNWHPFLQNNSLH